MILDFQGVGNGTLLFAHLRCGIKFEKRPQGVFLPSHPKGVFIYKIHVDFAFCIMYNTSIKSSYTIRKIDSKTRIG